MSIGTFDTGVTVLSQQIRALNLAWALVESGKLSDQSRIAVVGGGFAGLTVAAGLLKKLNNAQVTIFERRDTLLPLQHGSDTRWLHPHIYDWPQLGSESFSAALPLLNWTAGRASDVVVQVLASWRDVVKVHKDAVTAGESTASVRLFCNTQHLQISLNAERACARVEWIGNARDSAEPSVPLEGGRSAIGGAEDFDLIILAVGFGVDSGSASPYWRNETLAQPQLGDARTTYIVSGGGDGAMIDLFRLRIAHFRQDRILSELFSEHLELRSELSMLHSQASQLNLYEELDRVWTHSDFTTQATAVLSTMQQRLRHDSQVILHTKSLTFADLFTGKRVSFQNQLLAYLLFRSGGFIPSQRDLKVLATEHGVPKERVIIRHGTQKFEMLNGALSAPLQEAVAVARKDDAGHRQSDLISWSGGYFDIPLTSSNEVDDRKKANWRKEYLPGPTQLIASSFCSAVAGFLSVEHPPTKRLRVTLHRRLVIGSETVLQQACEYQGLCLTGSSSTAGRTFPSDNATIGLAFQTKKIVRSVHTATHATLDQDMHALDLNAASRTMDKSVKSIAAIPLLGTPIDGDGVNVVVGVLYLDSEVKGYFSDSRRLKGIIEMARSFMASLPGRRAGAAERVANTGFWQSDSSIESSARTVGVLQALEVLDREKAPVSSELAQLNYDFSDFIATEGGSGVYSSRTEELA
ncbi:FAD-dependent oxidoreductase [Herbiconiux sp. YIM B11900]|uniref:FAD-dependent oxidoreductase n=1 Tax=Herbiconiux sp. YIM B11900 TaxID=3404131 RepID=UPI003F836853